MKSVNTTCAYCGVGCGIDIDVINAGTRSITLMGTESHPANLGRLCSKGTALGDTVGLQDRLLHPEVNGRRVEWNQAITEVAGRLQSIIAEHGPDSVAFYVSGQLLTEDYYVANKLMKGFIGSANIDTNSRLCMSSSVAGHKRAFGSDTVPGCYEDLEQADLIILTGSNTAWCHPVVYQRIKAAKQKRPDLLVVVIDPRATATCDIADMHLKLASGTDGFLFNGLLDYLSKSNALDKAFVQQNTQGFEVALHAARKSAPDIQSVATNCNLQAGEIAAFYALFAATEKTVTVYSQGINQSSSGTDKVNAIINCHLATGRIGKIGQGPFSLTGQPNAMGGREVGGLANQLAAHMDFAPEDIDRVQRFWDSPRIANQPGLKAIPLFEAVAEGKIKAIWIMGTNPAVSLPNANKVVAALKNCENVIVSDCVRNTDTTALADILLPTTGWGEKDGTVTNSERRISRQRKFLSAPAEARHDWQIICDVAGKLGFGQAFDFHSPHDIFSEHAKLSGFENHSKGKRRDFNISALQSLSQSEYEALEPVQWPVNQKYPKGCKRMFQNEQFYTPSGRANFIPISAQKPQAATCSQFPFILNTGRVRDQWHTMTRTALAPQLNQHITEPFCEMHPQDAADLKLEDRQLVEIASRYGTLIVRLQITEQQQRGNLFIPMHWNRQFAAKGNIGSVVNAITDPVSGQPESKHTPVSIRPANYQWHGFVVSRKPLAIEAESYWVKIQGRSYFHYEIAGKDAVQNFPPWFKQQCRQMEGKTGEWLEYQDCTRQVFRGAVFSERGMLEAVYFLGPDHQLPDRSWVRELFDAGELTDSNRRDLLAGIPLAGGQNTGKTVCACFSVGENTIRQAIKEKCLKSIDAIGNHLQAGTNCGSCIPELKQFISSA